MRLWCSEPGNALSVERNPKKKSGKRWQDLTKSSWLRAPRCDRPRHTVKTGYPPRSVDVSGLSSDSLLSEPPLSLQRGDQLIVASKVGAGMSAGAAQGSTASTPAAVRPPAAQGAFGFSSTMNSRTATSMPAAQQSSQSPSQMAGSASLSRPPAAVKDAEVHVALNGGAEHLTLKVAPDDNSW